MTDRPCPNAVRAFQATTPVTELGLPQPLATFLIGFGYRKANDLVLARDAELLKLPGMGRTKLIKIRDALGQDTRHLKPRQPPITLQRLTGTERQLIDNYRRLPPLDKRTVNTVAAALTRHPSP
jgi:hypothetical protein